MAGWSLLTWTGRPTRPMRAVDATATVKQQHIGSVSWNIARLLESMAPLMEDVSRLQPVLDHYMEYAMNEQSETWAKKLGLGGLRGEDEQLVNDLLELLGATEVDMTLFFRHLCSITQPDIVHLGRCLLRR